jgi:protein-L-isoaspartate(D-aspartate) O-methyltransferase
VAGQDGEPGAALEPDAARARMVEELRGRGRLASPDLADAFLAVPRHLFLPEIAAADAYADQAFVIKTDDSGLPLSSSSQPMMMAIMLEQLGIGPGDRVLEVGTGTGYNAAVMARLAGETGLVVSVDIDPGLVARARANLETARPGAGPAGSEVSIADVIVICGDGGFGAPDYAPYDKIIVTAGAWDLAPQWLAQLGPGGRIVLPLSVRGSQLSVAFERADGHWRSRSVTPCGFIRMTGAFGSPESFVPVGPQPGMHVQTDDGRPLDTGALYGALTGPGADVPTGVRVAGVTQLVDADLWVALTLPDLVRVMITGRERAQFPALRKVPFGALADSGSGSSFAVAGLRPAAMSELTWKAVDEAGENRERLRELLRSEFEVAVRWFGTGGADLAGRMGSRLAAWQQAGRPSAPYLRLAAYPSGTAVPPAPGQVVLDRRYTRLALTWPAS